YATALRRRLQSQRAGPIYVCIIECHLFDCSLAVEERLGISVADPRSRDAARTVTVGPVDVLRIDREVDRVRIDPPEESGGLCRVWRWRGIDRSIGAEMIVRVGRGQGGVVPAGGQNERRCPPPHAHTDSLDNPDFIMKSGSIGTLMQ